MKTYSKYRLLFIGVPGLLALEIVALMSLIPDILGVPKLHEIGSQPSIRVAIGKEKRYTFVVAKNSDIENEWRDMLVSIRYELLTGDALFSEKKRGGILYSSRNEGGGVIHAVSVFSIENNDRDEVALILNSNIAEIPGAFWMYTTGTYAYVLVWLGALTVVDCIMLWRLQKFIENRRHHKNQ
jgi:hypothetical protein